MTHFRWGLAGRALPALAAALSPLYQGAWQLAQAEARVRCLAPGVTVSAELRTVIDSDLAVTRRGLASAGPCDGGRAAPVEPVPSGTSAPALQAWLARLEQHYRATSKGCGAREGLMCRVAFELGTAAGDAACAISTWNQPLPAAVAGRVRGDLQIARLTLRLLPDSSPWIGELDAIDRQLETLRGERVFHSIEESSASIAAAISGQAAGR
jgi:hypothetical protein